MKINRRELMTSTGASILVMQLGVGQSKASQQGAGWFTVPLGAGGYITGIDIAPDGTKVVKADTYGAYRWDPTASKWIPLITGDTMPNPNGAAGVWAKGCWDIRIAPSNTARFYMIFATEGIGSGNSYSVYRTDDHGRHWINTGFRLTNADPNGEAGVNSGVRLSNQKIAIDPHNPDVVYVGTPNGSKTNVSPYTGGVYRSFDAGANWERVSDVNAPTKDPGCAGILFDPKSDTSNFDGRVRTKRIILPSAGAGIWESTDAGQNWTKISDPATPNTTFTYVTTRKNAVIILHTAGGQVTAVTSNPALTWTSRANWNNGYGTIFREFYAVAADAASYDITITHPPASVGSGVGAFAVTGIDVSSQSTIFDVNASAGWATGFPQASITTLNANNFVFACVSTPTIGTDTKFTFLINHSNFHQEYRIVSSTGTFVPTATWGGIVDAIKQGTHMTLALDISGNPGGKAVYASSAASTSPGEIWTAQMDAAGTYWANNANHGIWRYIAGDVAAGWQRIDGTGTGKHPLPVGYPFASGNCVCVDPRAGHEGCVTLSGPHQAWWGFQTRNGNAAKAASISWVGSTGPNIQPPKQSDIPWLVNAGTPAVGDMMIDPTDGTYWMANGIGVLQFPTTLNYDYTAYNVHPIFKSIGIEQLVSEDACCPPGAPNPVFAVQDRGVMPSNLTSYPKSYFPAGNRTIAWQLDYASDDPSFMVVSSHYQGPQDNSGWNDNFGQLGSWHNFSRPPAFQANGGGSIACASSGGQGHTTANLIHVTQGTVVPQYTKDNGASWHTCVGLPAANYLNGAGVSPPRTRALAADRGDIGTFYAYVKATGKVYKSIDGGANFSLVGSRPLDSGVAAIYILTVPGKAGHIFLGGNSGNTSNFLYRSQDHGATWTQVGSISRIVLIALGKEKDPGGYPTLFVFGSVRGVSGYYRSTDEGTNWTPFGRWPADFPQTCQLDFAQCMAGDWNIYGRVYVGMGGSGFAYFSL